MKKQLKILQSHIGIDHFYLGFSAAEIKDLKALAKMPFCSFSEVESGKDTWRGVYWTATQGHYFEMIERTPKDNYQFGIAYSANVIQYFDLRKIVECFPKKAFKITRRRLGKARWFDAYHAPELDKKSVFAWMMHYYFCPRDTKKRDIDSPSFVERFTKLEMRVPACFEEHLEEAAFWAPIEKNGRAKKLVLEARNKDRSKLQIIAHVDPKLSDVEFISLTGDVSPFCGKLPQLKNFEVKKRGRRLVLRRRAK